MTNIFHLFVTGVNSDLDKEKEVDYVIYFFFYFCTDFKFRIKD